ncbi:MAG: branched-chain amino acid ABC transporter permease [Candidatus Tectomicrobia bacterium]|nr:branched-chain amino acid ABC transporter permease [Candidatus Tectomicrobia bacterium]
MDLHLLTQVLVGGVLVGGIYSLVALGLTMIFGVMRVINIAHGELLVLGSYITYWLFTLLGFNPLLSLFVSMPVMFGFGYLLQRYVVRHVVDAPELSSLLLTFGIAIFLTNAIRYVFTSDYRSVPYLTGSFYLGSIAFSIPRVVSFVIALAITVGAFAYLRYSRLGMAIRATSQHREVAMVCGIDVHRVYRYAFGFGCALAGAGGSLMSIMFSMHPEMGAILNLKAFCVVVLGGLGSYSGAFLGGLILGLVEGLAALYLASNISEAVAYGLLVFILLVRPSGIFGRAEAN